MRQKEKNTISQYKIFQAALEEFGNYSYDKSSINRICEIGKISKGVMYHYFKEKDELYLLCVKYCFDLMVDYYKENLNEDLGWREGIKTFLEIRYKFFTKYPNMQKIFFNTLIGEPKHLVNEIANIKKEFDEFTFNFARKNILKMKIRENLEVEDIIAFIEFTQNGLNEKLHKKVQETGDIEKVFEEYDENIEKWLDILLYGIVKND